MGAQKTNEKGLAQRYSRVSPFAWSPKSALKTRRVGHFPAGGQGHSSCTPAAAQAARVAPSHRDTCTSPTCALPSISMHRRLWPMPPPRVRGSVPSQSALWKASWARASQPAAFSWAARLSASTRMPMLLISIAQPSGSCQNRISPFSCQSS